MGTEMGTEMEKEKVRAKDNLIHLDIKKAVRLSGQLFYCTMSLPFNNVLFD